MNRPTRCSLFLAVASVLWGCTSPNVDLAQARDDYARADYFQAYLAIQRARAQAPGDPAIDAEFWKLRRAYLLDEAQRLVFAGREIEALESLEMVLALDADNAIALRWKDKALQQLSDKAVRSGDLFVAAGELRDAQQSYGKALGFVPSNPLALQGLEKLGAAWNSQQAAAHEQYLAGLRALGDHDYRRGAYHLGIALERDPALSEAVEPLRVARRQLAEEQFAKAKEFEAAGIYGAALSEYQEVQKANADDPDVAARILNATRERDVRKLADDGEAAAYRGDTAKARALLEEALAKTTEQADLIGERLLLVRERELELQYVAAKDLELQFRLDDALVAYDALEKSLPGFRDVRERRDDMRIRIEEATKAYDAGAQAEQAGDLDGAIDQFTDVQLYWKGYRDSRDRLEALRQKRDAARSGG